MVGLRSPLKILLEDKNYHSVHTSFQMFSVLFGGCVKQIQFGLAMLYFFLYQIKQMAEKDERIKVMNEVLSGIKV